MLREAIESLISHIKNRSLQFGKNALLDNYKKIYYFNDAFGGKFELWQLQDHFISPSFLRSMTDFIKNGK